MTEQKTDCWWFSEQIMKKVGFWESRSSWTHTAFGTGQLTMLFTCGGEDNHIHWNTPHKKYFVVKYVNGKYWVPAGHPPVTLSSCPAIFRLPCQISWPKSFFSLCLLHWSERTDNFSKNHSHAPQSFKHKSATNPSDVISYPNPEQYSSVALLFSWQYDRRLAQNGPEKIFNNITVANMQFWTFLL